MTTSEKADKNKSDLIVLGIETSCDETAVSIVKSGRTILSNVINSQIDIHKEYGGVVPEIASRNHTAAIIPVLQSALSEAGVGLEQIDVVAVTQGAGLIGALLVGVTTAKALSYAAGKPLVAVNHTKAHIAANYIAHKDLEPPFLCLVASGGHTSLIRTDSFTSHTLIGKTVDDAVGEAFDKVGRKMNLDYPAGAKIDRLAATGEANIVFTKPVKPSGDERLFSYSGLKTAVINYLHKCTQSGAGYNINDVCASFQRAAIDPLISASVDEAIKSGHDKIVLAGGVAANSYLREQMTLKAGRRGIKVLYPPISLCTDNGAMIASLGYYNYVNGVGISDMTLNADASLSI